MILAIVALVGVLAVLWARNRGHRSESAGTRPAPPTSTAAAAAAPVTARPVAVETHSAPAPTPTPARAVAKPTPDPNSFVILVRAKGESWASLQADCKSPWGGFFKDTQQPLVRADRRA